MELLVLAGRHDTDDTNGKFWEPPKHKRIVKITSIINMLPAG